MDQLAYRLLQLDANHISEICEQIRTSEKSAEFNKNSFWEFALSFNLPDDLIELLCGSANKLKNYFNKMIPSESDDFVSDYLAVLSQIASAESVQPVEKSIQTNQTEEQIKTSNTNKNNVNTNKNNVNSNENNVNSNENNVNPNPTTKIKTDDKLIQIEPKNKNDTNPTEIKENKETIFLKPHSDGKEMEKLCKQLIPLNVVFVSRLDFKMTAKELEECFKECGEIVSARIIRDREGESKGYGFVNFTKDEGLKAAIKLNGQKVKGFSVKVSNSDHDGAKMFLGNLRPTVKYKELLAHLLKLGPPPVSVCIKRGFAFVVYENMSSANKAVNRLDRTDFNNDKITAQISKCSDIEPADREMAVPSKTLYLRNVPDSINQQQIKEIFGNYGEITDNFVSKPKQSRRKTKTSFAFITFNTIENATNALYCETDRDINGHILRIEFSSEKTKRRENKNHRNSKQNSGRDEYRRYDRNRSPLRRRHDRYLSRDYRRDRGDRYSPSKDRRNPYRNDRRERNYRHYDQPVRINRSFHNLRQVDRNVQKSSKMFQNYHPADYPKDPLIRPNIHHTAHYNHNNSPGYSIPSYNSSRANKIGSQGYNSASYDQYRGYNLRGDPNRPLMQRRPPFNSPAGPMNRMKYNETRFNRQRMNIHSPNDQSSVINSSYDQSNLVRAREYGGSEIGGVYREYQEYSNISKIPKVPMREVGGMSNTRFSSKPSMRENEGKINAMGERFNPNSRLGEDSEMNRNSRMLQSGRIMNHQMVSNMDNQLSSNSGRNHRLSSEMNHRLPLNMRGRLVSQMSGNGNQGMRQNSNKGMLPGMSSKDNESESLPYYVDSYK